MPPLTLEVRDYTSAESWRWVLSNSDGDFVDDHVVNLDPNDPCYRGFLNLSAYLRSDPDPRSPLTKQQSLLNELGYWLGQNVLGRLGDYLVEAAPTTVAVRVPNDARALLYRPFELAFVGGRPIACQDVSLVYLPPGAPPAGPKKPADDFVRVLAVFSLPDNETTLALRSQRRALAELFDRLRANESRAVELTVRQWAVTRDVLADTLEDGRGWDVVHFSGHGLADGLVLETSAGQADRIKLADLVPMLRRARNRLKLVVFSSCHSAGSIVTDHRQALLPSDHPSPTPRNLANLAEATAQQTGAAVLAMRYSVADDFSIALTYQLYDRMFRLGRPLTGALQSALPSALGDRPTVGTPPISVAAPVLFGKLATALVLAPGKAAAGSLSPTEQPMAHFPAEPPHFVGRSPEMSAATTALAPESRVPGILLAGPAGIGKTTCALELAYRHVHRFGTLLWHEVHITGDSVAGVLERFAASLDAQVPTLSMAQAVANGRNLGTYLIGLTEVFEQNGILLIIDGIDALLTENGGEWRDPRWERVVGALFNHQGFSRTILTGGRKPAKLPAGIPVIVPTQLSPMESVLLARELPTLGQWIRHPDRQRAAEIETSLAGILTAAAGVPQRIVDADANVAEAPRTTPAPEYTRIVDMLTDSTG